MKGREHLCAALDFPSWAAAEPFARAITPEVADVIVMGRPLRDAPDPAAAARAVAASL
jgi:orotidine-5'-phosphate decarboxylase